MKDILRDLLDSTVGIMLAGTVFVFVAAIGFSIIVTSCGNVSVACVEAGGSWDATNGVCVNDGAK